MKEKKQPYEINKRGNHWSFFSNILTTIFSFKKKMLVCNKIYIHFLFQMRKKKHQNIKGIVKKVAMPPLLKPLSIQVELNRGLPNC